MIPLNDRLIKACLHGSVILTAILSIGSLLWWNYPLELLSHFRVYYCLLAIGMAIVCLICQLRGLRTGVLLILSLALIAFNSVWIVPWYLPHSQQSAGNTVRILTFNINAKNRQWDAIADAIRNQKPDVATIVESSTQAKEELSPRLTSLLPFVYHSDGGGLTVFSRLPLLDPQSKTFDHGTILITSLNIDQKTVELIAAHPFVPIKDSTFRRRNGLLKEIAAYLQQQPNKTLIFLGDMNLTPWSPYYSQFIRSTGLHNTRLGFGIKPSWVEATTYASYPAWMALLIKIPIDHIFVSPDVKVSGCDTLKAANADHRMLWSDLVL